VTKINLKQNYLPVKGRPTGICVFCCDSVTLTLTYDIDLDVQKT